MSKLYHITITNRVTGENLADVDSEIFAAAIKEGDGVWCVSGATCTQKDMAYIAMTLDNVMHDFTDDWPKVRRALARYRWHKFWHGGGTEHE